MRPNCESCYYFVPYVVEHGKRPSRGFCHRYPIENTPDEDIHRPLKDRHVFVHINDWCGEHERKLEKVK